MDAIREIANSLASGRRVVRQEGSEEMIWRMLAGDSPANLPSPPPPLPRKLMLRTLSILCLLSTPLLAQTNIAPAGTATQSSVYTPTPGGVAPRAIDGNRSGDWFDNSVMHTQNELNSWWQVDFGGQLFEMTEIRIFPRTDCCTNRNSNLRVSVFAGATEVWGQNLYTTSGELNPNGEVLPLPSGTFGDRVRVQFLGFNLVGNGWLHLAEVEIDGFDVSSGHFCGPAVPNSSGLSAEIIAVGSNVAGGEPLGLIASNLPSNEFGYFLVGTGTGVVSPPGSNGNLCLIGGPIGRFNRVDQIQHSQLGGTCFGIGVDTLALPLNPEHSVMAGETFHFQAWFRDGTSSNFTNAVSVTFL